MSFTREPNPMVKTRETVQQVAKYPIAKGIPDRHIRQEMCEMYGVRCALSEEDGKTVTALYYPYHSKEGKLVGFKKKDLTLEKGEKYHITTIGRCSPDNLLFGQQVYSTSQRAAKLFWVEGEEDVLATAQMLKDHTNSKFSHLTPHVVGLTNGTAHAIKNFEYHEEFILDHRDIILAFDMDRATKSEADKGVVKGQDAVAKIAGLHPDILHCTYTEHDPCDMLKAGKDEEFYWNLMKADGYEPEGFVTIDDVFDEATKMPEWGRPWPWPSLTKVTYGRRDGEGYYIGAGKPTLCSL